MGGHAGRLVVSLDLDRVLDDQLLARGQVGGGRLRLRRRPSAASSAVSSALQTSAPFVERLVHFWSNHFAISVVKLLILGVAGGFEADAIRQLRHSHRLIDDKVRSDPEANRIFLKILTESRHPERLLRLMNETGVIGAFKDGGRTDAAAGLAAPLRLAVHVLVAVSIGIVSPFTGLAWPFVSTKPSGPPRCSAAPSPWSCWGASS